VRDQAQAAASAAVDQHNTFLRLVSARGGKVSE